MKLSAFTGSSGVGKTTLLDIITKQNHKIQIVELSGRPYLPEKGDYVNNKSDSINRRISYGSLVTMTQAILNSRSYYDGIFYSRCAIDRLAYSRILKVGEDLQDIIIKEIKEILIPFIDVYYIPVEFALPNNDEVRGNNEKIRNLVDLEIKNILEEFNIEFYLVKGSIEERMKIINSFI